MYHENPYINRLVREWLSHERIIIACDIDDTLVPYNDWSRDQCIDTVNLLKDCAEEGIILILNTAREDEGLIRGLLEVQNLGLKPDSVNVMPPFLGDIPYGRTGKVYANIYLDDRAGLEQSKYYLRRTLEIVRQEREQQKLRE